LLDNGFIKIRNKEIAKIDRLFENTLFGIFIKTKILTSQQFQ